MWNSILNGDTWQGAIKNRAKDGSFFWVLTHIVPYKNEYGLIERFISIRHDITEEVKQRELAERQTKLSIAGELSAKILHDAMNPVFIIKGSAHLANKLYANGKADEVKAQINKINQAASRIEQLLSRFFVNRTFDAIV